MGGRKCDGSGHGLDELQVPSYNTGGTAGVGTSGVVSVAASMEKRSRIPRCHFTGLNLTKFNCALVV